jgi:hypothetical protein
MPNALCWIPQRQWPQPGAQMPLQHTQLQAGAPHVKRRTYRASWAAAVQVAAILKPKLCPGHLKDPFPHTPGAGLLPTCLLACIHVSNRAGMNLATGRSGTLLHSQRQSAQGRTALRRCNMAAAPLITSSRSGSVTGALAAPFAAEPTTSVSTLDGADYRYVQNVAVESIPDNLRKECVLFYTPDTEPLARKVAAMAGGSVSLGNIRWK